MFGPTIINFEKYILRVQWQGINDVVALEVLDIDSLKCVKLAKKVCTVYNMLRLDYM